VLPVTVLSLLKQQLVTFSSAVLHFPAMASSLSSVVSNLVRASMGSSVSNMVTDEDLDRHVAELILKDAKKKAERYGEHGIRAYLPSGGCVFLSSAVDISIFI
jgi:hypothetical protein